MGTIGLENRGVVMSHRGSIPPLSAKGDAMLRCVRAQLCGRDNVKMMDDLCEKWKRKGNLSSNMLKRITRDRIDCITDLYIKQTERKPLKIWYPLGK